MTSQEEQRQGARAGVGADHRAHIADDHFLHAALLLQLLGQDSQCLHAGALSFRHPRDGRPVMVFAPLPEYFTKVLEKLEKMG